MDNLKGLTTTKRANHKNLVKKLEKMGYTVYKCDYSYGVHMFQIEKGDYSNNDYEWYELMLKSQTRQYDFSGDSKSPLKKIVNEYYEQQGFISCEF